MAFRSLAFSTILVLSTAFACIAADGFNAVRCEGAYPKHLQGICTDAADAIYWSFTTVLVKTDANGRIVHKRDVADHHGDMCFQEGKVYVAVNLGKFNQPAGKADSWIYVYDGDSLQESARHKIPEVVHGAGGIAAHDGRFFVVGGLPAGVNENYVYEYDASFVFRQRHILATGPTLMGIQTVAYLNDCWWFGCYGNPRVTIKADRSFKVLNQWEIDCSLGIAGLPDGRVLVARGSFEKGQGYTAQLRLATLDDTNGLRFLDEPQRPSP